MAHLKGNKPNGRKLKASVKDLEKQHERHFKVPETLAPELHTAFGILDRNSDGHVYADDIYDMLQALGHNVDKRDIQDFIKDAANGGHSFQEDQFISWMEKLSGNQSSDDILILRGAFETFDKDKDGFISKEELQEGLKLIGENVSDKTLDVVMQAADSDRDGLINFEDFATIMA